MRSDLHGVRCVASDGETKKQPLPPGSVDTLGGATGVKNARTGFYRQTAELPKCCAQTMRQCGRRGRRCRGNRYRNRCRL
ncbi:hypothetical protein ACS15_0510 [Ralstonia insidiosa]|uniref:Uncharacterized protein n=1 Tax=Ralstonia insidiosa TaxID=190721 RepID=A0AAC9BII0_9RALS|nr:hypothetical protein ACS15_0510 [Ralstonia insidiosa]